MEIDILLAGIGTALLAFILFDAFITILSLHGAGPLTNTLTKGIWYVLLKLHQKKPIHKVLSFTGPLLLVGIVLIWFVILFIGWFFIFLSFKGSIVQSITNQPTTLLEKLYFTGTTLSDLGYGDFVPILFPWTLLSTISALSATLLITLSLTYILPVVSAGVEKKQLAKSIFNMGESAWEIIENAWSKSSKGSLDSYILNLLPSIEQFSLKHLSYPILNFFHSTTLKSSTSRAILNLSDAIFLVGSGTEGDDRPAEGFITLTMSTIEGYADLSSKNISIETNCSTLSCNQHLTQDVLISLGLKTSDPNKFREKLDHYLELRKKLVVLCAEDGWC
jgi:hypothetical protein